MIYMLGDRRCLGVPLIQVFIQIQCKRSICNRNRSCTRCTRQTCTLVACSCRLEDYYCGYRILWHICSLLESEWESEKWPVCHTPEFASRLRHSRSVKRAGHLLQYMFAIGFTITRFVKWEILSVK